MPPNPDQNDNRPAGGNAAGEVWPCEQEPDIEFLADVEDEPPIRFSAELDEEGTPPPGPGGGRQGNQ